MKPHKDELVRRLSAEWLRKAGDDVKAAEALLKQENPLLFPSCFHSQQAAEKYLKALLTLKQVEFPKTHSIRELLDLVKKFDEPLAERLEPAVYLTPYGVEARYPGDSPEPRIDEAGEALASARLVAEAVMECFNKN